jgi:sucrose-6-phosphate hydrolase SacC (GH32 family)
MRPLALVLLSALLSAAAPIRDERYRPQFHFSPERNWTNDPCGLIYSNGEYHLFFQFNPEGDQWGHMTWGHAVSPDSVHWKEVSPAIPEANGVMIFTGSSVQDGKRIASIYTGHRGREGSKPGRQNQNIAFSSDGHTWSKFDGNPVLDINEEDFRDPKVFWHEPTKRWIMLVMLPKQYKAQFYTSPDLKMWTHLSDFGPEGATTGIWECPDIYEVPVDGNPKNTRWVMKIGINPGHISGGSGEQYFVGRFDGTRFVNDNPKETILWTDYGRDCYCEFSFTNAPRGKAPVAVGWMSNWQYAGKTPTSPWRGQFTIPRRLSLETTPSGIRLVQTPADALASLRGPRTTKPVDLGDTYEISLTADAAKDLRMTLPGAELIYDSARKQISLDRTTGNVDVDPRFPSRTTAPLDLGSGRSLTLRIFVDRSSIELFADGGRVTMTNLVYPVASSAPAITTGAATKLEAWPLKSIWR